jgi:Flp pilus assembly pilin Flp
MGYPQRPDRRGSEGQGLVEYALIITLVAIVAVVVMMLVAGRITDVFNSIAGSVGG